MAEALVRFEREDAEGLIAVGSYVSDAAKRLGIKFEQECLPAADEHYCEVELTKGSEVISERTAAEKKIAKESKLGKNWRLACHAKIEKSGDVVVMTKEKPKVEEEEKDQGEEYRKRFEDLPLEKKMAELVRLESIALSETLSYIVNSPYKAADKLMDIMAEFGFKLDAEKKESGIPEEHRSNGTQGAPDATAEPANERSETGKKQDKDAE